MNICWKSTLVVVLCLHHDYRNLPKVVGLEYSLGDGLAFFNYNETLKHQMELRLFLTKGAIHGLFLFFGLNKQKNIATNKCDKLSN